MSSLSNSRWMEFIEARDSVLACLSLPLTIKQLLKRGKMLRGRLTRRPRKRTPARTKWMGLIL
jgi:hypothetical protein